MFSVICTLDLKVLELRAYKIGFASLCSNDVMKLFGIERRW